MSIALLSSDGGACEACAAHAMDDIASPAIAAMPQRVMMMCVCGLAPAVHYVCDRLAATSGAVASRVHNHE